MFASKMTTAGQLADAFGIYAHIKAVAGVEMDSRIVSGVRFRLKSAGLVDPHLWEAVAPENVVLRPSEVDPERRVAVVAVDAIQLDSLERHMKALEDDWDLLGFTSARIRHGFTMDHLVDAFASVLSARAELEAGR